MAWTAPMTAIANSIFTAAQFNTHVRDNLLETAPAKATTAGGLIVTTGMNTIAQRIPGVDSIASSEDTNSTSFDDLSTVGPTATVTTGARALVIVTALASNNTTSTSTSFSYEISGATSSSARDDTRGTYVRSGGTSGTIGGRFSSVSLRTGLTSGSNTFRMKYKVSGGTGTFSDRLIVVIPF